ncbi:MAG TPA: glucokinase [Acidobacteriaceae bacterium]|jgi:glucokinase|nr:glucokinase [Acidobacteriaceae bacterium]
MILAGDIGGTKVHLALYSFAGGRLKVVRDERFSAHEFATLDGVVESFLGDETVERGEIVAACFGCPGPLRDGQLKLTNLPWTLDARELARSLGIEHIFLINDLEANGYGIPELAPESVLTLHEGDAAAVGNRGLIAAGTGLGEALLIWDGNAHRPSASEGGHCDFAARTDREIALLKYLRHKLPGRVSWERVVSGLGIQNIYTYLRDVEKMDEPTWLRKRMTSEDPNALIGECAEDGSSDLCRETMQTFVAAYGAETGNIALKVLALGGMYLGGGIAPKSLKTLTSGGFMQAFLDKGRLSSLMESIPVRVILDESCALLGAAAYAEARASEITDRSERAASTLSKT